MTLVVRTGAMVRCWIGRTKVESRRSTADGYGLAVRPVMTGGQDARGDQGVS